MLPGAACTSDTSCYTADGVTTGEAQSCIGPVDATDGGSSGWVGGYCNPACSAAGTCPAGTCLNIFGGTYCMGNCTGMGSGKGTCRTSYVCESLQTTDGGSEPYGVCFPDCHVLGAGCTAPAVCNTLGYCN
jgi:hypothetical protein